MMKGFSRLIARAHPGTLILLSFVAAVCAGTGLLLLPGATVAGRMPLLDALFTAEPIEWDRNDMKIAGGSGGNEYVRRVYRDGWRL